jgi:hypothetical protein
MLIDTTEKPIKIEVFYFEGCPKYPPTIERIGAVLRDEACNAEVREIPVPDAETARKLRFLGSPTVRVNGVDIEPDTIDSSGGDFPIICRYYAGGAPSYELIRAAVRAALPRVAEVGNR